MTLPPISIDAVELRRIELPFVTPFRTASSQWTGRDVLVVRVFASGDGGPVEGWGECVAPDTPTYTAEYTAGAHVVCRDHLVPRLLTATVDSGVGVAAALGDVAGHPMAKAALEMAVLDAQLRTAGTSLARHLGATQTAVPAGATIGMKDSVDELVAAAAGAVDAGYRRVKVKVDPGHDVEPVTALRRALGDAVAVQVDANCAYTPGDRAHDDALRALDRLGLLLIEQPYRPDRFLAHAELAARLDTPLCLDETVTSDAVAAEVIELAAASVVNVKTGRVGGVFEAKAIHDRCRRAGLGLWHGGMLETGIGRAAALAVAALPGFDLPADLAAADRYWARDIVTEPAVLRSDGTVAVPGGAGLGVDVDVEFVEAITTSVETIEAT